MQPLSERSRARLAFLRGRLAELRKDHATVSTNYLEGRLSLADEVAQLAVLNQQVYTVVAEVIAITRPVVLP
jgi:hypothetical protein